MPNKLIREMEKEYDKKFIQTPKDFAANARASQGLKLKAFFQESIQKAYRAGELDMGERMEKMIKEGHEHYWMKAVNAVAEFCVTCRTFKSGEDILKSLKKHETDL